MIKKRFLKTKQIVKTTFRVPEAIAQNADSVQLLGEFNNWGKSRSLEMRKLKNGEFKAIVELPEGEYEFKYLIDNERWENDDNADKYVGAPFGGENSVVCIHQ